MTTRDKLQDAVALKDVTNTKRNEVEPIGPEAPLLETEREVKIFISSPFKDMNAGTDDTKLIFHFVYFSFRERFNGEEGHTVSKENLW